MSSPDGGLFTWRWPLALALALLAHGTLLGVARLHGATDAWTVGAARGAGSDAETVFALQLSVAAAGDTGPAERAPQEAPQARYAGGGGQGGYYARVRAHLQRHRRPLPFEPAQTATAVLQFRVDAAGAVSAVRLVRSAGDARLDQAALDLLRRAAPLPRPPDGRPLDLRVPFEFE